MKKNNIINRSCLKLDYTMPHCVVNMASFISKKISNTILDKIIGLLYHYTTYKPLNLVHERRERVQMKYRKYIHNVNYEPILRLSRVGIFFI